MFLYNFPLTFAIADNVSSEGKCTFALFITVVQYCLILQVCSSRHSVYSPVKYKQHWA